MQVLQPPTVNTGLSHERALGFLDSKYRLIENLADLQHVVDEAKRNRDVLHQQATDSAADIDLHVNNALSTARDLLASAREASLARHTIADDLASLTDELVPVTSRHGNNAQQSLLEDLEGLHKKLEELEITRTYVQIIQRATQLRESAIREFNTTHITSSSFPRSSLAQYVTLQDFVSSVITTTQKIRAPDESTELKLVEFLCSLRNRTWKDIRQTLSSNLLVSAEQIKWPMKVEYHSLPSADRGAFENAFSDLLRLQEFGDKLHGSEKAEAGDTADSKPGLYPLQSLVVPIAARFKFHFDGQRSTNRLDKPEWYFTHILNIVHEHGSFMETVIQPLVNKSPYSSINVFHEFINLLLPIVSRKIRRTVPPLLPHPSLLAHTVYQTLVFDGCLRDEGFSLKGTTSALAADHKTSLTSPEKQNDWEGLSDVILGRKEWFDAWRAGEQKFADDTFNDIISSPGAWLIVDDGEDPSHGDKGEEVRPTSSARRVKALIEQVTDRYQPLPRFAHRAQFLITIQIPILESYYGRISSSLDAYETLSSSFMRVVPGALAGQSGAGVDTRRLTTGAEGLGRLLKAFVSARWIRDAMEAWGEEVFFLELWVEINEKSALRARASAHHSLLSTENDREGTSVDGTLFDELIEQYSKVAGRAEDMMIKQVCYEIEGELKPYFSSPWEVDTDDSSQTIPSALLRPLSSLSSSLKFFATSSLPADFVTTSYKRIVGNLTAHFIQRLVHHRAKGRFTSAFGKQFASNCRLWVEASQMALVSPSLELSAVEGGNRRTKVRRPRAAWAKLMDAAALLSVDEAEFPDVLQAVFEGGPDRYSTLSEALGLSGILSRVEAQDLLRARTEAPRR